jgi:hypothetical protein
MFVTARGFAFGDKIRGSFVPSAMTDAKKANVAFISPFMNRFTVSGPRSATVLSDTITNHQLDLSKFTIAVGPKISTEM